MTLAAVSQDDTERVALLQATRLLDTSSAPPAFDALVRQLAAATRCPLAAINLVDAHRVWSLSSVGLETRQASRQESLCWLAIRQGAPLMIGDTSRDARCQHMPAVQGPMAVRAYAGMPLIVEGQALGVLCAMDREARTWQRHELDSLRDFAGIVSGMLEATLHAQRGRLMEARMRTASLAGSDWLWETDKDGVLTWVSAGLLQHTGVDPASEIGLKGALLYTPRNDDTRAAWERFQQARARREPFHDAIGDRVTPRGRITVSISGTPIFNSQGMFKGYRGASRIVTRQIEAEEDARRSDQLLRQAIESFQISVMITNPDGRVVLSNQNWKDLNRSAHDDATGYWRDTLVRLLRQGAYPDAIGREDEFLSWRQSLYQQTEPAEVRFHDRWLLLKDHQLPDKSVVHFAMDITQKKRDDAERQLATEKLRVSEELYRSVASTISDGLVIVELGGRVVAMNPAASRILGVSLDVSQVNLLNLSSPNQLGLTLLKDDLLTPLPLNEWPITETLTKGQRVVDRINPLRRPDGEVVWVQSSCLLLQVDNDAPPFAAMLTLRDITQERRAQQALQLSEERWKFALEGSGDGVWDWDFVSGHVYFSHRWKAMLGYDNAEFQDLPLAFLSRVHPADRDAVAQCMADYFEMGGGIHQIEFRLQHRDGHYLTILSKGKVVSRDQDGKPQRVVGTHADITPVKQAERALREKQLAEAASQAKTEFLSRMSHEIRTPLNAIFGFAQLMQLQLTQRDTLGAAAVKYVEQILQASHHLMGLVNDVLDLQQVETGVVSFKPEPLCLAEEVAQCLSMLAPLADERRITLINTVTGDERVVADRRRLRQVIMNIGSNAIKYNNLGGHMRVGVARLPEGAVTLTIEDNGPGMSAPQLSRLFQPFERLGRETSNIEGTGLGLIITRSLIEAMGGRMDIQSQPGAGTKVGIVLPVGTSPTHPSQAIPLNPNTPHCPTLADLSPGQAVAPNTETMSADQRTDMPAEIRPDLAALAAMPPLRVLYVEDNRINALLFEEALRPFPQIDLEIAEDGQMALSLANERAPDVLVLDAHLPGMSGFDVLKALRQLPRVAGAPAFMCSADAMPEDVARAMAAGFTGYWTKPIDIVAVTQELCRLAVRDANKGHNPSP